MQARLVFFLLFAAVIMWNVYRSGRKKDLKENAGTIIMPVHLMMVIIVCTAAVITSEMTLRSFGILRQDLGTEYYLWMMTVVITAGIYWSVLVLLKRHLRSTYTAYTCTLLWLMPNFLFFTMYRWAAPVPLAVITIPSGFTKTIFYIWAAGFLAVSAYYLITHFIVRRKMMSGIREPDEKTKALWKETLHETRADNVKCKLAVSPALKSPLTIGVFNFTMVLLLPEKEYTEEELRMIFRHELVHLIRGDSKSKLSIAFFTAMNWFNPFMYPAMKHMSEDMELSCDEIVTSEYGREKRRKYAELILNNTAETKGFTTCLSASAEGLRYRFHEIIHQTKRKQGWLTAGLLCICLMYANGIVTFSENRGTLKEYLPEKYLPAEVSVFDGTMTHYTCVNPEGLYEQLSSMPVATVPFGMDEHDAGREYTVVRLKNENSEYISLTFIRNTVQIWNMTDDSEEGIYYIQMNTKGLTDQFMGYLIPAE